MEDYGLRYGINTEMTQRCLQTTDLTMGNERDWLTVFGEGVKRKKWMPESVEKGKGETES